MTRPAPFGFSQVVFLSHVLGPAVPVFPGDPPVQVQPAATVAADGFYLQHLSCGEQSGTHWAAAAHFSDGEPAADQLDPADFFHPAAVIDVRDQVAADPDFALGVADVAGWESANGRVPPGAAVLLRTGWADRWDDPAAYLGADSSGGLHYPGFGVGAVAWLIEQRDIAALGSDTMGIDPGRDASFAANRLLLHGRRMHLENLCGLGQLPPLGAWIIVGGFRTAAGSGSPATVFGLIP
jgi:kynurenine formamidase